MAVSKKQQAKLKKTTQAKVVRAVATHELSMQRKASQRQAETELKKSAKAIGRVGSKTTASSTLPKPSSTLPKRANQSIVARGGKPMKTYYTKKVK
jgi:hypothetical protein